MERLLIYSQDGMGLGHLRRTRRIAGEVLLANPNCSVLILADSPVTPFFEPLEGVDYVKLPTIVKTGALSWQGATLSVAVREMVQLRATLILDAFRSFRPDAVLVDHMPVGALGELKPMLREAKRRPDPPRLFLGLRDVLDAPQVIRRAWSFLGAYEYLRYYDSVLIYGCRNMYPVESRYLLTPHVSRLRYCNYVGPRRTDVPETNHEDPFVLVMGGGGKDAVRLARMFLEAMPLLLEELDVRALVVTGPNMSPSDRECVMARTHSHPVDIISSVDDASELLRRASAVVTMAGYNSVCELLSWRKKGLLVPRSGPSQEQLIRSQLFTRHGLVRMVRPSLLTPRRLASELISLLREEGVPDLTRLPPLDGAERAARLLLGEEVGEGDGWNLPVDGGAGREAVIRGPLTAASSPSATGGPRCSVEGPFTFGDLQAGQRVKIKGKLVCGNRLVATKIILKVPSAEGELEGPIQALDVATRTLRILNRDIPLPEDIVMVDRAGAGIGMDGLEVGAIVKLKGYVSGSDTFMPRIVKLKGPKETVREKLCGQIDQSHRRSNVLDIMGFKVSVVESTEIEGSWMRSAVGS